MKIRPDAKPRYSQHREQQNFSGSSEDMIPTPSTSHVCFDTIYEPAEDSYLFLDTLSSASEVEWLSNRFKSPNHPQRSSPQPVIAELGTGSGVILAFVTANASLIFGRSDVLTLGTDANVAACSAARKTVDIALHEKSEPKSQNLSLNEQEVGDAQFLAALVADLCTPIRAGTIDVLIFNPPYVPTPELPQLPSSGSTQDTDNKSASKFERDSHLLSLSYAGGESGMEATNRLLKSIPSILNPDRGVAYVLLCAQNKPDEVMSHIRAWGSGWNVEIAGRSGGKAGWEKLVIVKIWKAAI